MRPDLRLEPCLVLQVRSESKLIIYRPFDSQFASFRCLYGAFDPEFCQMDRVGEGRPSPAG